MKFDKKMKLRSTPKTSLTGFAFLTLVALPAVPALAGDKHGVDISTLNRKVKPSEDFYEFANGGWLAKSKIPADEPSVGAFEEVALRNRTVLRRIVEKAAKDAPTLPAGSDWRKIGDFYRVALDEKLAEKLGTKPLDPLFTEIDAITDRQSLLITLAHLHRLGINAGFAVDAGQDAKDSTRVIFEMGQGGISLPERDYYLRDDPQSKALREQYRGFVGRMLTLAGEKPDAATQKAASILAFETRLAKASLTAVQLRDPQATYHKMTLAQLSALTPGTVWTGYFNGIGLTNPGDINVGMPEFMKAFDTMLGEVSLDDWKTYLRWQTLSSLASYLNKAFFDESFKFGSSFTGQKQQAPRWRRALGNTQSVLGEAVGQLFVAETFPPAAKQRALDLVLNLKSTLRDRIQQLDWMGTDTKAQALRKLDTLMIKIGYPDKFRDYSALKIGTESFAQNILSVRDFAFQRELNKIGQPVDRTEWGMNPQDVNAYYNPAMNEIVFPAGILQPPFFDAKADDASNYGGIGMVIGHEMTHGFDDQGRQYDADGNLKDWWTAEDAKRFAQHSESLVKQYGDYIAVEDKKINGQLTQGENIADLGGLTIAYYAFEKTLEGKQRTKIDGFTPEQRFFLSLAQIWRSKRSPQFEKLLVNVDPHSPNRWRVFGPLYNFPPFIEAFGAGDDKSVVKLGSGTTKIW